MVLPDIGAARVQEADAEALVAATAAGCEEGLAGLYDLFGRRAYGIALRVLRDETLAEDAVQDAFLTVWRRAAEYRPERGAPSAWIFTIVHRRAVDLVRREQRRRAGPIEEYEEPAGAASDETVLVRAEQARVRRALAQLGPEQRRMTPTTAGSPSPRSRPSSVGRWARSRARRSQRSPVCGCCWRKKA
jgi:RNA polymerase sigma-70 factor (ECF subfamily)